MAAYFSDRERGPRPRTEEQISENVWGGIVSHIQSRVADGSLGYRYPLNCPNGAGPYGCDEETLGRAILAEIPDLEWPLNPRNTPDTLTILDLVEFCHHVVASPIEQGYHSFFGHTHLRFEPEPGQSLFRDDVNRILARNGLAYNLREDGNIVRLASPVLHEALTLAKFRTGDKRLDDLLETARAKFTDPNPAMRREALEKLWDAWEKLKTIETAKDKKASTGQLLIKLASEPNFRGVLEQEAVALTKVGNTFHIRHSETTQVALRDDNQVDYLFHRLFALIHLALRMTDRGG
jgi:hypothetical protein